MWSCLKFVWNAIGTCKWVQIDKACHSKSTFMHTLNSHTKYFFHAVGFFSNKMILVSEWTLALCVTVLAYFTKFHSPYCISDGVSCQLHITVTWIRSWVRSCGIYDGQSGTRMGCLWFSQPVLIPLTAVHSLFIVSLTLYHLNPDSIIKLNFSIVRFLWKGLIPPDR
jgi:hypothetical protein